MNGGDSKRLRELVERALSLPAEERKNFLVSELEDEESLLQEALGILEGVEDSTGASFLEPPSQSPQDLERGELEPGSHVLGDFVIERELGRGGMGIVYLARQRSLDREVAIKVLVTTFATPATQIDRFHREARSVAGLRHPGIVQVYVDGNTGGTHWFAMEYVQGHDLCRELELQQGPSRPGGEAPFLPRPNEPGHVVSLVHLCIAVAEALHHAHEHGLVHRDVKPGNILLQEDGRALVGDFGLVRDASLGNLTEVGTLLGSPHYMSPEQARVREPRVDHRTDVYSLGVVLFELATLRRPYEGQTSFDILSQIRRGDPRSIRSRNPRLPRDLDTICAKAMAARPSERYRDARALADDLRRFLRHEAILARPATWGERARRWCRRHRGMLVGGSLLILGSFAGGLAGTARARERSLARLTVRPADGAGRGEERVVLARRLDPETWTIRDERVLGRLPVEHAGLEPGQYRLAIRAPKAPTRELLRTLRQGEELTIELSPDPIASPSDGMVLLAGGLLAIADEVNGLLPLDGREVPIEPFWIDRTEVSNAAYRSFLEASGHPPPTHWAELDASQDELPVVKISWEDARAFSEWRGARLPSLAEWLWAARGVDLRRYPWSGDGTQLRGNCQAPIVMKKTLATYLEFVRPVASDPEACTPEGLYHMFGNVGEFTESLLVQLSEGGYEPRPGFRFYAGFDWDVATSGYDLRKTYGHIGVERSYAEYQTGFRCALSARP